MKNKVKEYINELLFPRRICPLCDQTFEQNKIDVHIKKKDFPNKSRKLFNSQLICTSCRKQLKFPSFPSCKFCHKPLYGEAQDVCYDCMSRKNQILNRSATLYNSFIKDKIYLYKYRGKESLSKAFAYLLTDTYHEFYANLDIDCITYVPIHPNRLLERGFNQAEQLAMHIGVYSGIEVCGLLEKVVDTKKQSKQGKWDRLKQIEGTFKINNKVSANIKDKKIMIIDDIYTTGYTISELAKELLHAGAREVYSLTLARALGKEDNDEYT